MSELPALPEYRYDLGQTEYAQLENALVRAVRASRQEDNSEEYSGEVFCVWTDSSSPYSDLARTHEAQYWPYMPEVMADKEQSSDFLLVVDDRDTGSAGVVRASRITFATPELRGNQKTGMAIIDDVLESGQDLTIDQFLDYYTDSNVDINTCFSVESNIRIKHALKYNGLSLSEIGYLSMFHRIDEARQGGLSYIFAAINQASVDSFGLIDLRQEALAGREDIRVPGDNGEFDDDFKLVALPTTEHNLGIFRSITELSAPEVYI